MVFRSPGDHHPHWIAPLQVQERRHAEPISDAVGLCEVQPRDDERLPMAVALVA